jgi:hypothetical protein
MKLSNRLKFTGGIVLFTFMAVTLSLYWAVADARAMMTDGDASVSDSVPPMQAVKEIWLVDADNNTRITRISNHMSINLATVRTKNLSMEIVLLRPEKPTSVNFYMDGKQIGADESAPFSPTETTSDNFLPLPALNRSGQHILEVRPRLLDRVEGKVLSFKIQLQIVNKP